MIELQLCIRQPEKALGLITHLQNRVLNGTTNIKINLKHSKVAEKDQIKDKINKVSFQYCVIVSLISIHYFRHRHF